VASIVNSGSVDDGENGIDRNRIGAFLDKMSPRNSPIGFERPQGLNLVISKKYFL